MPKKTKNLSKDLDATEIRAMELKYQGLSLSEMADALTKEGYKASWQTLGGWFRDGGKLFASYKYYCSQINAQKFELAISKWGEMVEEATKTVLKALQNGNIELAKQILEQSKILKPAETFNFNQPFSYERFIHGLRPDTNQNRIIDAESEVLPSGAAKDNN